MFNLKIISTDKFNLKKRPESFVFFSRSDPNFNFKNAHTGKFQFENRLEFLISRTFIQGSFNLRTDYNFNFKNKLEVFFF